MFSGVYWNQPVCLSVCGQSNTFCQNTGGGIKSHSVTALVYFKSVGETQQPQAQEEKEKQR